MANLPGKQPPVAQISTQQAHAQGDAAVIIGVNGEVAIKAEFDQIDLGAVLSSKDGKIYGQILHSSLGQLNNYENTLGINATEMIKLL